MLDALRQDYPIRNKPPLSELSTAWSASTKLVSRVKALALLGFLFYVVLPVTLAAAAARALLAWLFVAKAATANGNSKTKHAAMDGHGSKARGTAIVSGAMVLLARLLGKAPQRDLRIRITAWLRCLTGMHIICAGGNKTKALHVCRHLHRAGWRVVLVDSDKWVQSPAINYTSFV